MVGLINGDQPYVPSLGRLATPGGSLNPYASPGNDPVNAGVYVDDLPDATSAPGDATPTYQKLLAPFTHAINTVSRAGQTALQIAAGWLPPYILGEAITGRDVFNHKVPAWQQALDIAAIILPGLGELGPAERGAKGFSAKEEAIANYLRELGHDVVHNPLEGVEGEGRQGDALVDGLKHEFKTLNPGAIHNTVRNVVRNSLKGEGQARHIVIDARNSGLTLSDAQRGAGRAFGAARGKLDRLTIIGKDYFWGRGQ